jgi:hypothetical protein
MSGREMAFHGITRQKIKFVTEASNDKNLNLLKNPPITLHPKNDITVRIE